MFMRLREHADLLSNKYVVVEMPLTHMINQIGIVATQSEIDRVILEYSDQSSILLFVCQHILVSQLRFNETSIVCTPHATVNDNFISIPHYPLNINVDHKRPTRSRLFSFFGSTTTHESRRGLVILYPNDCFDTQHHWGLDKKLQAEEGFIHQYTELLGDSRFSLCPRGTGVSSVRLFESAAMGAIPVIIANGYKPPLSNILKWEEFSLILRENRISKLNEEIRTKLEFFDENVMREKLEHVYNEYLCPNKFHLSITEAINNGQP